MASDPALYIPTFPVDHNGVPGRLREDAADKKKKYLGLRTMKASEIRDEDVPVLPPGISREVFNLAIEELKRKIGDANVVLNDKPLDDGWYMEHPITHDAFPLLEHDDTVSSATACPGSAEEVQAIVIWANKYQFPVFPISIGRNIGYGGAGPRVRGSLTIDLGRRMNKVLKLDEQSCSCIVEPGVTYFALYETIQRAGVNLMMDCPDLGGGSLIGNICERGIGYTPLGDHFANHCGMEVVLPTGEMVRLGMGALPGKDGEENPTWASYQYGYGPYSDGIFTHSNFGIVTKMGIWLMPKTEVFPYAFSFKNDGDYSSIMEIVQPLILKRVFSGVVQIADGGHEVLTGHNDDRAKLWSGKGAVPRDILYKWMDEHSPFGACSWIIYGAQYGPKEAIDGSIGIIKDSLLKIPGSNFLTEQDFPEGHYFHHKKQIFAGRPTLGELYLLNWTPNSGHLFFSPILPLNPKEVQLILGIVRKCMTEYGFDPCPQLVVTAREIHCLNAILYDVTDKVQKKKAFECMQKMIELAANEGYGEYRTHQSLSDQVARTYGWNDQALMRFNETLKDALDPNGILSPGRCGIWPRKYRGKGWEILPLENGLRETSVPDENSVGGHVSGGVHGSRPKKLSSTDL